MAKQKKVTHCMICGKESEASICEHCSIKIQGEVLDKKHEVEKKGKTDSGRT
jgi:hypothetical protein